MNKIKLNISKIAILATVVVAGYFIFLALDNSRVEKINGDFSCSLAHSSARLKLNPLGEANWSIKGIGGPLVQRGSYLEKAGILTLNFNESEVPDLEGGRKTELENVEWRFQYTRANGGIQLHGIYSSEGELSGDFADIPCY